MKAAERNRSEFATTRWSLVLALREQTSEEIDEALTELCRRYWFPLYAFVRRSGYSHEDAEDLTQAFFAAFLERGHFARADPQRGRFRNFLLTSLRNSKAKASGRHCETGRRRFAVW